MIGGYIGKTITQLPHLLPIIEHYKGTIYTDSKEVKDWMNKYSSSPCILSTPPSSVNLLLADYFYFPNNNTIQLFHGVSEKTYIKNVVANWYKYIINPSPQYINLNTALTGFSRYNLYVKNLENKSSLNTCLYCPTIIRDNSSLILDYINKLLHNYARVIVKLHPFNSRMEDLDLVQNIIKLGASLVSPSSEEYIRYERLFNSADVLASDMSSIMYEFSLTGKKIITPEGEKIINPEEWFYSNDIYKEIEKCLK